MSKVLSTYRSYDGNTTTAITATVIAACRQRGLWPFANANRLHVVFASCRG